MHHKITKEMKDCIASCLDCSTVCNQTAAHCLSLGGEHAQPQHILLLVDCVDICQTSANFMNRVSARHVEVCGTCADICRDCAESCRSLEGKEMERCAEACSRCAELCAKMGETGGSPENLRAADF